MPDTAAKMGVRDVFDPAENIAGGTQYLAKLRGFFRGIVPLILAGYNAGPGAVTRWRQARGDLPVEIFVEEIPYAETRNYVRKVLAGLRTFRFVETMRSARQARRDEVAEASPGPEPTPASAP